jgi:uncharacterized protein (TIGR02145 family)
MTRLLLSGETRGDWGIGRRDKYNVMKNHIGTWINPLFIIGLALLLFNSCEKDNGENNPSNTVTDIEGNIYHTVTIGLQVWMVENLRTTRYNDGTPIPVVPDNLYWSRLTTGAYSDYDNTPDSSKIYGKLYNWYAVNDARKLAPVGWHVPSDEEWGILLTYLGGESVAGGKLKETGTDHWESPNVGATNEYGFTALPGGRRDFSGTFNFIRHNGYFWSSTEWNTPSAYYKFMFYNGSHVAWLAYHKTQGLSVRCIRD